MGYTSIDIPDVIDSGSQDATDIPGVVQKAIGLTLGFAFVAVTAAVGVSLGTEAKQTLAAKTGIADSETNMNVPEVV